MKEEKKKPMIPPKHFDIFPLTRGCLEGLDTLRSFFKPTKRHTTITLFLSRLSYSGSSISTLLIYILATPSDTILVSLQ